MAYVDLMQVEMLACYCDKLLKKGVKMSEAVRIAYVSISHDVVPGLRSWRKV
jgi:hypothetical protein